MKIKSIALFSLVILQFHVKGQDISGRIDESFLRVIVHITIPKNNSLQSDMFGSGFLIAIPISNSLKKRYLVTNKHMIGSYSYGDSLILFDKIIVDFYTSTGGLYPLTIPLKNKSGISAKEVILHPNPKVDVAIIDITDIYSAYPSLSGLAVDTSYLIRLKGLPDIAFGFGSQAFALGYPDNIMIAGTNQPIGKSVYVASSLSGNFQIFFPMQLRSGKIQNISPGGSFFLVDGLIIGGNSGGPVVNPKEIKTKFEKGQILRSEVEIPNLILGIVSGGVPQTGLTVVFSSDNILDLISQDLKTKYLPTN